MALNEYRRKRDFSKTPEPASSPAPAREGWAFVVHKHGSQRTHYDLRLELGGTLKSWAVPRGPSLDPREKRLAVHVEDHPLEYTTFEGVIPAGQYGAGPMMIWDRGRWSPEGDANRDYKKGEMKFRLEGERLRGRWMLVRTGGSAADKKAGKGAEDQWLLLKERDRDADPAVSADAFATSVATGRTMAQIAAGEKPPDRPLAAMSLTAANLRGARRAEMPRSLKVQLAVAGEGPASGPDWLHEIKFDGYRLLAYCRAGKARLITRRNQDWTDQLASLARLIGERLPVDALIDGEIVMLDPRGISDFQALQNAISGPRSAAIVYFAFDLPWCDGHDLTGVPIEDRRRLLASLIGERQEGRLRFSQHLEGEGADVFRSVAAHGLEGIISKRKGSLYTQTRSPDWRKAKAFNQQEFVVGGFSAPSGTREQFGALLVGYYDKDRLIYAGRVGTGFSTETLRRLGAELRTRAQKTPPFVAVPAEDAKDATWVKPDLVAQVQFLGWTGDHVIRFPSFRGLRDDRDPRTVTREPVTATEPPAAPAAPPKPPRKPAARTAAAPATAPAGPLALTHPDRVVFPDRGRGFTVTKRQLAEYYEAVARFMLPHVADRPLSIVRCPDGEGGKEFFQKHPAKGMPDLLRATAQTSEGPEYCFGVHDVRGLVALVQSNALEIHAWGSRLAHAGRPDRLVFDLDPGPDVSWREVADAALMVREALTQVRLRPFVRLTGGKGLHVVVPIKPEHPWPQAKAFSAAVAAALVRLAPTRFVAAAIKAQRQGRIYLDYLRNTEGATAIASYSTRARPGAPVALPIGWDELAGGITPDAANVISVTRRMASGATDAWAGIDAAAAGLPEL